MHPTRRRAIVAALVAAACAASVHALGLVTPTAHADRPVAAAPAPVPPAPLLAELYDSTGISTDAQPATGALDAGGRSLSAAALARAGWVPGARLRINGIRFGWPAGAPGTPDNAVAAGQRIRVEGTGTALGFLAVGTGAGGRGVAGTGTVTYTDGTVQRYRLSVPDWRSDGRGAAIRLPYLNTLNGPDRRRRPRLYVREVPLPAGKEIRAVTLPADVGAASAGPVQTPALHVFAVGLRPPAGRWTGSWATAQHSAYPVSGWSERTVRMPVRTSIGGSAVRIRLSNVFATTPLRIGHATVGRSGRGAALAAGPVRHLTFGGRRQLTVPAGGEAVSDPVPLAVPARTDLTVSLYLPGRITSVTRHWMALREVYWTRSGSRDHAADAGGAAYTKTTTSWPFLSAVDVLPEAAGSAGGGAVVVLGDSITDGAHATPGAESRWTDGLADRLAAAERIGAAGPLPGVLNAGVNGNRLLRSMRGNPAALDRLDRDVFGQSGVRTVVLFEGVNDINNGADADAVIEGMTEVAARARAHGLRVLGCTVVPFRGWAPGSSDRWTPAKEVARQRVNAFVRDSAGVFDAVLDFDAVLRDPARPERYAPALDSGDHLHPGDAGMAALAEAVDPALLVPPESTPQETAEQHLSGSLIERRYSRYSAASYPSGGSIGSAGNR